METTLILGYTGALFIGLILGLAGGGGSILTVPLLVYLLGYNPVVATAYSLFVVGASSVAGVWQKYREGLVVFKTGLFFSFPSFVAVYASRRFLVPAIPDVLFPVGSLSITREMALMLFFALVMVFAAYAMIRPQRAGHGETSKKTSYPFIFVQGLIIGTVTGIIGAGGGFLYVPALVLWTHLPMKKAVGTSLVIISINSLIGFTGDLQKMEIEWSFLLTFTAITIIGILLGGILSRHVSDKSLKKGFGWLILLMSFYILIRELTNT